MIMLWTDYFVYFFVILLVLYLLKISSNALLQARWRRLFSSPVNLFSVMILAVYLMIGVLDSIHWKQENTEKKLNAAGIVSALDILLYPLASQVEQSYSAPFSIYGVGKEKGSYPRLIYAGKHLKKVEDKPQDLKSRTIYAVLGGSVIALTLSILILLYAKIGTRKNWEDFVLDIIQGKLIFPWRTFLLTFWGLTVLIVFLHIIMPFYHPLGTNQIGEDVLYQALKSVRTGLIIGTLTTLVTLPFAIFFGVIAGYFKGWIDDAVQYVYTTLSAIPGVLLIAAAVLVMEMTMEQHANWFETTIQRGDIRLLILCLILGVTSWSSLCRLLRAETLKLSQHEYVQAARTLGVTHYHVLLKHLVPNLMHLILITVVLDFSGLVLAEAVLSYVGVGVDPTTYSWGMMINGARLELARIPVVWWSLTAAFMFMFFLVLSANVFSDAVRDLFDPHYFKG
jgi:peptide/nickel transport system permease protein